MASNDDDTEHHRQEEEGEEVAAGDDEGAHVAPIVNLEEVAVVTTGDEEDEDVILELKCILYRFDSGWKERGIGTVKLCKHRGSGKFLLVMRQCVTLRICAIHYDLPTINLQEYAGDDECCVWYAADFADEEVKEVKEVQYKWFCMEFASMENRKKFKEKIQEIVESQPKKVKEENKPALAELLDKLSVEEEKEKNK